MAVDSLRAAVEAEIEELNDLLAGGAGARTGDADEGGGGGGGGGCGGGGGGELDAEDRQATQEDILDRLNSL